MKGRYQKQGLIFIKFTNKNLSCLFIWRHVEKFLYPPSLLIYYSKFLRGRNIRCRFINPTFPRN